MSHFDQQGARRLPLGVNCGGRPGRQTAKTPERHAGQAPRRDYPLGAARAVPKSRFTEERAFVTACYVFGLLASREKKVLGLGPDSLVVLFTYIGGVLLLTYVPG